MIHIKVMKMYGTAGFFTPAAAAAHHLHSPFFFIFIIAQLTDCSYK
jgi:hypothetical protein